MTINKTLTWVASLSPGSGAGNGRAACARWLRRRAKVAQSATTKPAAPSGPVTLPRAASPATMAAAESFDLPYLLSIAQSTNKGVEAAQANVDAASAAINTARAYPNPQVEVMYGRLHGKEAGVAGGNAPSYAFVQKFDYPHQRSLRQEMAGRGLEASQAVRQAFRSDLSARVKTSYYQVLRRETELAAAQEDLALMRQIHSRAKVRVDVGEAPRYELIKAETELLAAQKTLQTAELRVEQAKTALRQQVGGALPPNFRLTGTLGNAPDVPMLPVLRDTMQAGNAELAQRRMELERARLGVDYQRSLRWPEVAVRASTDRQPDNNVSQIGLVMTIPLWDRRSGPVGEAAAQATQARTALEAREFELNQELRNRLPAVRDHPGAGHGAGVRHRARGRVRAGRGRGRLPLRRAGHSRLPGRAARAAQRPSELIAAQYELQVAAIQIEKLMSTAPGTAAGVAPGAPARRRCPFPRIRRLRTDHAPPTSLSSTSPAFLTAAAVMPMAVAGCSDKPEPAAEAPKLPPGIVKPEENLQKTLKVAPVATSPFSEMLRVSGRIDFDEQRVSRIGASVTGRVTDLYGILGQEVKAGQVLARLHSSELGAAQMAFLKAEAQSTLQARNAERARQLFAADVIGRAELQRRESEYAIAAAEMRAYRDQLRVLGMSGGVDCHAGQERQHRLVLAGLFQHPGHGGGAQRGPGPGGAAR